VISPEREKDMAARAAGFQITPRATMLSTYPTQNQARISAAQPKAPPQQVPAQSPQQPEPARVGHHQKQGLDDLAIRARAQWPLASLGPLPPGHPAP
jgi:hypothetical protein